MKTPMTSRNSEQMAAVCLYGDPVGSLNLRENLSTFELLDHYLDTPNRPVLGMIFEESPRRRWRQAQRLPEWFSNLLPEERLRDLVAEDLGLDPQNEFRLLVALGLDLPGAVTVEPIETGPREQLRRKVAREVAHREDEGFPRPPISFSVAGVQLKLSMLWSGKALLLAGKGELGDRYVKFPARSYAAVPENEFSMMTWAKMCAIDVPH